MRTKAVEDLVRKIADLIRASASKPDEQVEALLVLAGGRAVQGRTHTSCQAFSMDAHDIYHQAEDQLGDCAGHALAKEPSRAN